MSDSTDPGSGDERFQDPTAPSWPGTEPAPPTQPVPTDPPVAPPSPYAEPPYAEPQYGQAPYPPPADPQQQPGQGPPGQDPYGQPAYGQPPYGQPAYGQPPYGQAPYEQPQYDQAAYGQAYSQSPYAPSPYGSPFSVQPPARNTSTVVLTVVSGIATVLCCLLGVPSLILAIVALTRQSTDPASAGRLTRYGWITFAALMLLGVVGVIVLGVIGSFDSSYQSDFDGL